MDLQVNFVLIVHNSSSKRDCWESRVISPLSGDSRQSYDKVGREAVELGHGSRKAEAAAALWMSEA